VESIPPPPESADPSELFAVLLPDTPLTDVLQRVTTLAARTVSNCTAAGITLAQTGRPHTPVYTDERSPKVDQVQYDNDSGPCLDALREGRIFMIADTATESRWPEFCAAAAAVGFRSTLSVPIDVSGHRTEVLGALNLYSETPESFDEGSVASTESLAHQAAIVIANAQAYWGAKELSDQLQAALESRAVIEQAKGILMGREGITADKAFEVLVRASQRENRKLRELAAEIVARAERRGPKP
jgi:GAF domain-containing protein